MRFAPSQLAENIDTFMPYYYFAEIVKGTFDMFPLFLCVCHSYHPLSAWNEVSTYHIV